MKENIETNRTNDAKVVIDFQINVTKIQNGQTTVNNHMDGKFTMEINEVRQFIKTSVASAIQGVADSIEN